MRTSRLLNQLSRTSEAISVSQLAHEFNVSERTVRSDLSDLRSIQRDHGFQIVSERGKGIRLLVKDSDLFTSFLEFLSRSEFIDPSERSRTILQALVLSGGFVSAEDLAVNFDLSVPMVNIALQEASRIGSNFGISIQRTRHHGTRAVGKPDDIRFFLARSLLAGSPLIVSTIRESIDNEEKISAILLSCLSKIGRNLRYVDFCALCAFVTICAADIVRDTNVEQELSLTPIKFLGLAELISEEIYKELGLKLTKVDVLCIAKALGQLPSLEDDPTTATSEVSSVIISFLAGIDGEYQTSFLEDKTFVEMLEAHIALLVKRLLAGKTVSISFAEKSELGNSLSMDFAVQLCEKIYSNFGVEPTQDEVFLIAMHFIAHEERTRQNRLFSIAHIAVVCATGGGSATLVKMQLSGIFPNAQIDTVSYLDQRVLLELNPDLIISMVPLLEKPCAPTIYINEILSPSDLSAISNAVRHSDYDVNQDCEKKHVLSSLIKPELFAISDQNTYQDIVHEACIDCVRLGYADEAFANSVEVREKFSNTIFLNGICAPHPVEPHGIRDAIAVRINRNKTNKKEKEVRVIFLICLTKQSIEAYKAISTSLFSIMNNQEDISLLESCISAEEFINQIKNMEVSKNGC